MSREAEDSLERELAELTHWRGGDVQAWRAALGRADEPDRSLPVGEFKRFWSRWASTWAMTGVAAAIVLLIIVPVLHSLGSRVQAQKGSEFRYSAAPGEELAQKPSESKPPSARLWRGLNNAGGIGYTGSGTAADSSEGLSSDLQGYVGADVLGSPSSPNDGRTFMPSSGDAGDATQNAQVESPVRNPDRAAPSADRYVIRKATIELRTADVRAAFLKASHLVSEAHGEYVQESSLTGGDQRLEGNLTLRVVADRLSAVLQALRELGTVRAESAGGEDVTTQVVDLEARVSNEKRVEAELLQLMEKRTDAPLKEVLEVRAAIGNVRQTIETLTGQRERFSRLVSLATVLVIIRPADAAAEPTPPGLWDYFTTAISRAAQRGVQALINTLAGLVLVLIGGAVWLILLSVAIWIIVRWMNLGRARTHSVGPP